MLKNTILSTLAIASIAFTFAMEPINSVSMTKDTMMDDKKMMNKNEGMVKEKMMYNGQEMNYSTPTRDVGMGSRGEHVINLQKFLIDKGFLALPQGVSHGYYGSMTKKAVMAYQESLGVTPTGYFGPKTRMMMQEKMKMSPDADMMKQDGNMMKEKIMQ
jgi:peptidoglycan hydrolase-like protein with peptidoglycan-binding domain